MISTKLKYLLLFLRFVLDLLVSTPISLPLVIFALVRFCVEVHVREVGLGRELHCWLGLLAGGNLKWALTGNSGHRRDWARRRPPLRRPSGHHAPCNPGSSAYIALDTESVDGSRGGRADRLSAMDTDDASVLVQLSSFPFSKNQIL